eukprot:TRINITY_DN330_c0_g4_i2.p1 TRINITY_DN330_c0_g4~~TRINITY_DN330_c0_g4_i2.p1  ORF type:complete len:381 (-),score=109.07 TRINITY_DN330_c0_g4_i2:47-1078(-)
MAAESTILASKVMKAVLIHAYDEAQTFTVEEKPLPIPDFGEVVIKVAASPINPSDLLFLKGIYGVKRDLPTTPGFEGSGTVIASGGGFMGWRLVGKRVAFFTVGEGAWAENVVVPATSCVPIPDDLDLEAASCSLVNPLTILFFMDHIRERNAKAVVSSAAAGQVGKMLFKMCTKENIPIINIVRRAQQVEQLENLGAEHIVNTSEEGWKELLKEKCTALQATLAFDAVGGSLTGDILAVMPPQSHVAVYGAMTEEDCSKISPADLIFRGKTVGGFGLRFELQRSSKLTLIRLTRQAVEMVRDDLKSEIQGRFPLSKLNEAIAQYKSNMSAGKVLIVPSLPNS